MKKFKTLLEGVFQRYQGGNFLPGDVVQIKDGALTHEWTKSKPAQVAERMKEMMDGDLNLRISSVKALRPAVAGDTQQDHQACDFFCDVVRERAPGLFLDFLTLPAYLLELDNPEDANLPPVPDSIKKKDPSHIKPEVVEDETDGAEHVKQTRNSDTGGGKLGGDRKLATANTPGLNGNKWKDTPGGGNYPKMSIYMESLDSRSKSTSRIENI